MTCSAQCEWVVSVFSTLRGSQSLAKVHKFGMLNRRQRVVFCVNCLTWGVRPNSGKMYPVSDRVKIGLLSYWHNRHFTKRSTQPTFCTECFHCYDVFVNPGVAPRVPRGFDLPVEPPRDFLGIKPSTSSAYPET